MVSFGPNCNYQSSGDYIRANWESPGDLPLTDDRQLAASHRSRINQISFFFHLNKSLLAVDDPMDSATLRSQ